jgi:hypothetical protein
MKMLVFEKVARIYSLAINNFWIIDWLHLMSVLHSFLIVVSLVPDGDGLLIGCGFVMLIECVVTIVDCII